MVKVHHAVAIVVNSNPLYSLMLSSGLVNLSALAREIKPIVTSMVGKDVNILTIVKSLERLRRKRQVLSIRSIAESLGRSEVIVYNGIGEAEIEASKLVESNSDCRYMLGEHLLIMGSGGLLRIIAPLTVLSKIPGARLCSKEYSLVKIRFSEAAPVGIVTFIVQLTKAYGISLRHILRYDNEVYIVVERAYSASVLKLIEDARRFSSNGQIPGSEDNVRV